MVLYYDLEGQYMRKLLLSLLCMMVSACSFTNYEQLDKSNTGFIGDYSKLERIETTDGLKSFRYASDRIKSGVYDKVIIEPVEFYPREVASEQMTQALFDETKSYINKRLVEVISLSMAVVDKPQEGAIRLTPRISAIKTSAGDLKVRELIPIGSVIALSKKALGYRYENVDVYMAFKATDSIDGSLIGSSIKQGKGEEISGANEVVTFDKIKPLLEVWIKDAKHVFESLAAANEKKYQLQ